MPRKVPPPKLYKYQRFNEQALANLKNATLWFSPPIAFNDPFDCALPVIDKTRLTDHDFERALHYVRRRRRMTPKLIDEVCPGGKPNARFRESIVNSIDSVYSTRRKLQLEERGVACLSAKPLDIMMWSHYADGHRGFCLEFDTSFEPFSKAFHVRYSQDFPWINPVDLLVERDESVDPENHLLVALVLTKAPCWQYEEEWRVMHMEASTPYVYDYHALTAIYFGAAMPFAHKEILSLILQNAPTQSHEVYRDDKGFSLRSKAVSYQPFKYR